MYRFAECDTELIEALRRERELACVLADDLARLLSLGSFCEKSLAGAPVFDRFFLTNVPVTVCMGVAHSPGSNAEALTHTDEILVDGRAEGWIRTRSGLYRLGREVWDSSPR